MIKSKVIEIIQSLDPEEIKEFGEFVSSPYFNKNARLTELYELIKKYYPDFTKKFFTKEKLYEKLFPRKKYNDGSMRKLLSGLQNLGEEYLAHSHLDKKDKLQKELFLLNEFDLRKLDRLFEINFEGMNRIYKKLENLDDDYFKTNFDLQVARINFDLGKGRGGSEPEKVLNNLLKCATYLICYSIITSFKLNQDVQVTRVSFDFDKKDTIIFRLVESLGPGKFIESIRKYSPEFHPVIEIYFNRFMIVSGFDEDDSYYWKLKDCIMKNINMFSRFEKYNLMLFLENSCSEKILAGKDFRKELHNITLNMLSTGLYTSQDEDYLPLIRYRLILRNALIIGEYEWAKEFAKNYLDKLHPEFRENMNYFSKALLSFFKKQFEESLENISKFKSIIYTMKFDVWILKLQTEFELGYWEEALYSLDSFKHSIKNDITSPDWIKARFNNFMNYYRRLLTAVSQGEVISKMEKENLEREISASPEVFEKEWLLEKLRL